MGFKEFTSPYSGATDANHRAWVAAFINGWRDAGLKQADDTGQIAPATITAPTTTATINSGYAIFYLNDSLHAVAPIYLKVEFGVFGTGGKPAMWITVARGTDGAGQLLGILLARTHLGWPSSSYGYSTTDLETHFASTGEGYFAFLPHVDVSGGSSGGNSLIVERSRSADGAITAEGLMVAHSSNNNVITAMSGNNASPVGLPLVWAINYSSAAWNMGMPPVSVPAVINGTLLGPGTSLAAGSIGPVFPWVILAPGIAPWQSCVVVSIPAGDFPGGVFVTTLCGRQGTFRAVPASLCNRWGFAQDVRGSTIVGTSYVGAGIRWED